jgi:aspartate oxidase
MSRDVGILRSGHSLAQATKALAVLEEHLNRLEAADGAASIDHVTRCGEARNLLLVSRLVCMAAAGREESRGAHFRDDFPQPLDHWRRRQSMTMARLKGAETQ